MKIPSNEIIEYLKKTFPVGTRIKLTKLNDKYAPHSGTLGTVRGVDDMGSILVRWDSGSSLNVVYGEDECEIVEE